MTKPFSPAEARTAQESILSDPELRVINELIALHLRNGVAAIPMNELSTGFRTNNLTCPEVKKIEAAYMAFGWKVKHEPATHLGEVGGLIFKEVRAK